MEGVLDMDALQRLHILVEELTKSTTAGDEHLATATLAELKRRVRHDEVALRRVLQTLLDCLNLPHSQKRLRALLVLDVLFRRSKVAREVVVENMDTVMARITNTVRGDLPLPPPALAAARLNTVGVQTLTEWDMAHGASYRVLHLGVRYLRSTLPSSAVAAPDDVDARAERRRGAIEQAEQTELREQYVMMQVELPEAAADLRTTVSQIERCLPLLIQTDPAAAAAEEDDVWEDAPAAPAAVAAPRVETNMATVETDWAAAFRGQDGTLQQQQQQWEEEEEEEEEEEVEYGRDNRLTVGRADVQIDLEKPLSSAGDTSVVVETLRGLLRLLTVRHGPRLARWAAMCMRIDSTNAPGKAAATAELVTLRALCCDTLQRCKLLGINSPESASIPDTQPSHRETAAVAAAEAAEAAESTRDMRRRACSPLSTAGAASASPSQRQRGGTMETGAPSLRSQLLARAPMVESGQFLETWDRSHLPTNARGLELENHWGRVDTEATVSVERMAELAVGLQASYYVPPLPAVAAPACRAPVGAGGGRLCSRRDSVRCPFHGPIVPRDDQGQPLQPLAQPVGSAPAAAAAAVAGMSQQQRDRMHNEAVMSGVDPHVLLLARAAEHSKSKGKGKRVREESPERHRDNIEAKLRERRSSARTARQQMHRMATHATSHRR